jgi:hypothetical protein
MRTSIRNLALAIAACALASCMTADQPTRTVADVLRAHTAQLMTIPGVVGTGEGEIRGEPAVIVLVSHHTPEVDAHVPHRLEGYPVQVKVVGEVREKRGHER